MRGLFLLAGFFALFLPALARAELCRFAGSTTHGGRIVATTNVGTTGEVMTVDVVLAFAVSAWFGDFEVRWQEITDWRGGELQRLAQNWRTLVDGRIKRQQWDVFVRAPEGLLARRVQAKTLPDFQRLHPGFARHWALAGFGQSWLPDYDAARPERRPDLDLPARAIPSGLRAPLALALYWSRYLPPGGGSAPLFLAGFKRDSRADLVFGPATEGDGWRRWQAPLRHPGLEARPPSTAIAWVSPDNYLMQLAIEAHASQGSGQIVVRGQGCQGVQIAPR